MTVIYRVDEPKVERMNGYLQSETNHGSDG